MKTPKSQLHRRAAVSTLLALTIVALGCESKGTSTGNPYTTVNLKVTGSAQASTVVMNPLKWFWQEFVIPTAQALTPPPLFDSGMLSVNLGAVWLAIKEVEFKPTEVPGAGEVDGDEISFLGPFYVNLLDTNPDVLGTQNIEVKAYRRIKMKLHKQTLAPAPAPPAMNDKSIYLTGTVGPTNIPFTFTSEEGTEFEIGGPNGVTPTSNADLLVAIRLARLFSRIDLSAITGATNISESNLVPATNPCPNIDASANDLYTCFRKGLQQEANFGKDNGDDDLDSSDDTVK